MKAAYITQTGSPDQIHYGDLPDPTPTGTQVLVRVGAVSVNPIDTYLRAGANYWELPRPYIIGCDLAGTIVQVGDQARRFKVGQRVWGSNQGLMGRQGTFSELAAVDEQWLYATPDNVSDEAAAACALVGITAHLGLFREAGLRNGETLLVHGGSGGVGSMVVQMAKIAGARVIATAGTPGKAQMCREFGADEVILHREQPVVARLLELQPGGVDVVWETQREPDFDQLVSMLAERGRIVLMAGRDARPPFPVGPFYVKGCSMHGFVMFKATPDEQRVCGEAISKWLSEGKLRAHIGHRFSLAQAADAHRLQEDNTLRKVGTLAGKIVLSP